MTITVTHTGRDLIAIVAADTEQELREGIKDVQKRYPEWCPEPMDEPHMDMTQRWSAVLRPTVEMF